MLNLEERSLARLTIPDVLTPVQYYEGVRAQHPEAQGMKRLVLAVFRRRAALPPDPCSKSQAGPSKGFWRGRELDPGPEGSRAVRVCIYM